MLELSNEDYERHLSYAKYLTNGNEPEELLHEVYEKIMNRDLGVNKEGYILKTLKNTYIDKYSNYNKIRSPRPVKFCQESTDLPEAFVIFKTLHELRSEGKGVHAERFLNNYFAKIKQKEIAEKEGVGVQAIKKSIKFVKVEIRKRYELD